MSKSRRFLKSTEFLKSIKKNPENYYIIHYSCESLDSEDKGRITSIAVVHFSTEKTTSFSPHAIAAELNIAQEEVSSRLDDIEKKLIEDFYKFIKDKRRQYWIHWNMRNQKFGFEHIERRFRVLGTGNPPTIPIEYRINLSDILKWRYGDDYVKHPRLENLMELNGGIQRDFLEGSEEVTAFNNLEFKSLHNSTLRKTGFFWEVLHNMMDERLKTKSKGFWVRLDNLFGSECAKTIGLIFTIIGKFWHSCQVLVSITNH